jgi:hypothetical protein
MKEGNVSEAVANEVSWRVLQFFGNSDEIIDNLLDAEDRRLFYFLQDLHVLKTHGEEEQLLTGINWRVFYWNLDLRSMTQIITSEEKPGIKDVYLGLPDEVWHDHGPMMKANL